MIAKKEFKLTFQYSMEEYDSLSIYYSLGQSRIFRPQSTDIQLQN
ncbi:MAG TPA: hypothetical protein VJ697_04950 [Nitrososphaeraceae archaeon]|nr:hypothetical protein [Nitrososphaeraceae archaeon]